VLAFLYERQAKAGGMKMEKPRLVSSATAWPACARLEELLKIAPSLYDITVFGAEPHPNYNRILLSPVLAGEQTVKDIVLNTVEWYARTASACTSARRSRRSTASRARWSPRTARASPTTACCSPPAPIPSSCRCPASTSAACSPIATSRTPSA
jgi:hypothetical protein